jgi:hypothetical protein
MGSLPADVNEDGRPSSSLTLGFGGRPSLTASAFTADIFIHNLIRKLTEVSSLGSPDRPPFTPISPFHPNFDGAPEFGPRKRVFSA